MGSLLTVEDLVCGYNGTEVIRGLSFSVEEGEFFGIIGPNGSGKTTLFRAIGGTLKPRKGRVLLRGREVSRISRLEMAREVALLPQFMEILFPFTVEEFVMMGRYPHIPRFGRTTRRDLIEVEKSMEMTGTLSLRNRMISELSGGERQRCLLAQGLAQEPRLLLLDEPTAHLDIGHQIEAMDIVRSLNKKRTITVLVILHDLNLAGEYCDRLVLLNDGWIHSSGKPKDVLTYQAIEEVYKTVVVVSTNPVSSSPYVLPVPKIFRGEKV